MRTIVHLSDLHFGRVDQALINPLITLIKDTAPDLTVISGDLTQRAHSYEFEECRIFLNALPQPQIVVPGNHDIPLYNIFSRFFRPLVNYQRIITDDLEPSFVDEEIAVFGVNTARSLTFKDGRINKEQIARLRERMLALPKALTKVVVTHHPFDLPDTYAEKDLVDRAPLAMKMFSDCGADLLLAGHLHASHADDTAARYKTAAYAALAVQAGTATSTRGRGEPNSFNMLRIESGRIAVERYSWDDTKKQFTHAATETFVRKNEVWSDVNEAAAGVHP